MKTILIGIGALALALGMVPAGAAVITTTTQTITFGGATDFSQPGTFALFNASLGTLLTVNVTNSYGFTTQITVSNAASGASTGTTGTTSYYMLNSNNGAINSALASLFNTGTTFDNSGNTVAYAQKQQSADQFYALNAGQSKTLDKITTPTASSGTKTTTTAADLAAFEVAGGGTADLTASTLTRTSLSNSGGNTSSQQTTSATGDFSIFYTYDDGSAVPEPASWSMMILGFGLTGTALRRRRAISLA